MQRSAVTATDNCPVRRQFNASRSLRQVALQSIWLFQESLISIFNLMLILSLAKIFYLSPGAGRSVARIGCRGRCLGQAYEPWQALDPWFLDYPLRGDCLAVPQAEELVRDKG